MKRAMGLIVICFIVFWGFGGSILAEENKKEESLLTVPWDEFREFLPLDKDEIILPMESFQKLLVYSGIEIKPEHSLNHGNVVLTKEEFKTMINGLKPPLKGPKETLPFDYLITRTMYKGNVEHDSVTFTGVFSFNVLKKGEYIKIPLLPQNIALDDVTIDGDKALVVIENGYHHVMISKPGEHVATVSFSLKPAMNKGIQSINLTIQQTPMTLLTFGLPFKNMEVTIPQAQKIAETTTDHSTLVSASITPGQIMTISWRKKDTSVEKIPAKLYSEIHHLVAIDDDALKINSEISYRIFHSEVKSVRVQVPRDINVLNVTGEAVGEWREMNENGKRILFVPFTYGKKDSAVITVCCEKPLSENNLANTFAGMQTLGTVHETGYIGMELKTSAEVKIAESTGLETIGARKLPPSLYTKSARPLMYAFKYAKQPFSLSFETKKHLKVAVPVAAINSANIVTLFTEDGKVVYHLMYQVKNSAKQFLKIKLPDQADVWSVFVDNQPVESSLNVQGKLLVPLIRSRPENNGLGTFPVEVIYCMTGEMFSSSGTRESHLPPVDILISRLMWSVYLPNDYAYHYFQSTLEKEEMIRGVNVLTGSKRQYNEKVMNDIYDSAKINPGAIQKNELKKAYQGKDYTSHFKNLPLDDKQISQQMEAELNFSGRLNHLTSQRISQTTIAGGASGAGVMPIQIAIPTGGQVYRFAKTIVTEGDPLNIRMTYSSNRMTTLAGWLISAVLIGFLYLMRKPLKTIAERMKKGWDTIYETAKKHEAALRKIARSKMTPFILLGLTIVCHFISARLALLVFFLFWISAVYWMAHGRKQKQRKITLPDDTPESTPV